jgi:putative membrane protein
MSAPGVPQLLVSHWQLSPVALAGPLACIALYVWATTRVRSGWPVHATASFLGGVACLVVALQSGIGTFDDRLLSAHMVQHMLLLLLAPLLLLGGQPVLLAMRAVPARHRPGIARVLTGARRVTRPVACLAVFYAVVLLTHLPAFYDAALSHAALHALEHLLYLTAGVVLWWPVIDADPAPSRRLGGLGRLIYVLAAMPAMALVGGYLNRHPTLVYPSYGPPAHALGVSAITDQQQAGALMWVAGNVIMVAVGLWAALAALVAEERRLRSREAREVAST